MYLLRPASTAVIGAKALSGETPTVLTNPGGRSPKREATLIRSRRQVGQDTVRLKNGPRPPEFHTRRSTPWPAIRPPLCRGPTTLPSTRSLVTGTKHTPLPLGLTPPERGTSITGKVHLPKYPGLPRSVALDSRAVVTGLHPPTPPSSGSQISTSHNGYNLKLSSRIRPGCSLRLP